MGENSFSRVAAFRDCKNREKLVSRAEEIYEREGEIRSPYARDYTRILHSTAFRRLKHKTQVFFNTENDHICTRMEHVAHVESVSYTVAKYLGLNDELTRAIAFGHDLGHAPFGHQGETVLSELSTDYLGFPFWHERNGLRMVDGIELLEDDYGNLRNLNLTYAVRDGIISHCGEIDQNGLRPRTEFIDLSEFTSAGQYQPATWEGCVVKTADKIAYVGRDIEDALALGFIEGEAIDKLHMLSCDGDGKVLNTAAIMHGLIADVCKNSSPESGITLSPHGFERLCEIREFNYKYIYRNSRFKAFEEYSALVLNRLFGVLCGYYAPQYTLDNVLSDEKFYPLLCSSFAQWLAKYCDGLIIKDERLNVLATRCKNKKIYGSLDNKTVYAQAVIDFLSGMTDAFAIKVFGELLKFV